jgi:hypothetical protein
MSGTSESPVVVGVDGSQAAQAALRWAIDYARCVIAPVHAVAVRARPLVASDGVTVPLPQPMWDADLEDRFEAEAERWLANALPARTPTSRSRPCRSAPSRAIRATCWWSTRTPRGWWSSATHGRARSPRR